MGRNIKERRRKNYRQSSSEKNRRIYIDGYIDGNTVRRQEILWQQEPVRQPNPEVRKNRDKSRYMSAGYLLFLGAALVTAAFILVNYVQLQAELTNLTKTVATKESQLNDLRLANDEDYNRIIRNIDLEEIKRIAMGELGMVYAEEGQIISYTGENNDYMRRISESGH